jgi:D-arabinitol dehydrogenase (NADP+)
VLTSAFPLSGLILAQLLKLNGASRVVIAANRGIKTKIARDLDCGDEYIELDRLNPEPQWTEFKAAHPYGFDIVVRRRVLIKALGPL